MNTNRPLYEIAAEVRKDWGSKVYFGAVPYLREMSQIDSIDFDYGTGDTGKTIVIYFLSNATTWRGDTARRVKAELKAMLK